MIAVWSIQNSLTYEAALRQACYNFSGYHTRSFFSELDALAVEQEEEGPSYLADLNKVPDFIDEAPVEVNEVCSSIVLSCRRSDSP